MDQTEAKELLQHIQVAAQKSRSNLAEVMEGISGKNVSEKVNQQILHETQPGLYPPEGKLGILEVVSHVLDISAKAGKLEQMAVYNVLTVCNNDASFPAFYGIMWGEDLPEPMWAYGGGHTWHHEDTDLKARARAALMAAGLDELDDQGNAQPTIGDVASDPLEGSTDPGGAHS